MSFFGKMLLVVCFVAVTAAGFAQSITIRGKQDSLSARVSRSLQRWYRKYPEEKIFVHTAQDMYSSGETIWYKVYAMAYGKPSAISGVVYVQLSDTAGNVIAQNKLQLADGLAHGDISIDPKLKSGWYKLTAFTSWMMNFDRDAYYIQKIYVHNAASPGRVAESGETLKKNYHIEFFPEGGDLVNGSIARVAFKAYGDDGAPAKVTGTVTDMSGNVVANLLTAHDGMGDFTIEPAAGQVYTAAVKFPDGTRQALTLPGVNAEGLALQVKQADGAIKLRVALSTAKKGMRACLLTAVQNSGIVNTFPLQIADGFNEFKLPGDGFSTGILRLTLFDENGLPVAERLLFINKHDLTTSGVKAGTLSFSAHGANAFSVAIKDDAGRPVKMDLSVSVTDGGVFNEDAAQNIYSALLLSPELKGDIYNPGYYFKNQDDSLARQLDLVMLTNGWRRFSWQKILDNQEQPLKFPAERSLYLAGMVENYKAQHTNGELNIKLLVFNHDSTKFMGYATPDSAGRFILRDFNHSGLSDVYLQPVGKKGHILKLKTSLLATLADSLKKAKSPPFAVDSLPGNAIYFIPRARDEAHTREFANTIELKQVDVKARKITPVEQVIADHVSSKYTSEREFNLDLVNNPTVNMPFAEYINGKFPNLLIRGTPDSPQFIYRGGNSLGYTTNGKADYSAPIASEYLPYFYLNEAPSSYDDISDLNLNDVALIRFIPPPVWFAPFNGGSTGAIMVYTKNHTDDLKQLQGVSVEYDHYIFNGYTITREFSSPDYVKLKNSGLLDDRITLYWAHDLQTDSNGILNFRFNNTDITKKYKVVIQGMDDQGRLVYLQKTFQ